MNRPTDPHIAPHEQLPEIPRKPRCVNIYPRPTVNVRKNKAHLTGLFAVLRVWSEKEKARPPPSRRLSAFQFQLKGR